ncbi:MAG: FAD-dependent oxidoreductase [Pseudomonadota bacterium]
MSADLAMSRGCVIVGGGQAALSAAAKLRALDAAVPITMLSAETTPPYQRPPLSKKYLSGAMDAETLLLRPLEWYADNAVALELSTRVVSIDRVGKTVTAANGRSFSYGTLLLATGTHARHLPAAMSQGLSGISTLRTDQDADDKRPLLSAGKRLVIIGGGYIGLEVAAVARSMNLDVTVVEAGERILQRVACEETSDYYRTLHTSHGVRFLEVQVASGFEGDGGAVSAVILADGTRLLADHVLLAIGVEAQTALASDFGLAVERGVTVDAHCRTTDPAIFAAGDCTQFEFRGAATRLESVPHAIHQAETAAENMLGFAKPYEATPWFWSDQYDVKLQIAGLNTGYDSIVHRPGRRAGAQSIWYYKDDALLAVDAMNDAAAFMTARRIIEAGASVPKDVAVNPSANLKDYLP